MISGRREDSCIDCRPVGWQGPAVLAPGTGCSCWTAQEAPCLACSAYALASKKGRCEHVAGQILREYKIDTKPRTRRAAAAFLDASSSASFAAAPAAATSTAAASCCSAPHAAAASRAAACEDATRCSSSCVHSACTLVSHARSICTLILINVHYTYDSIVWMIACWQRDKHIRLRLLRSCALSPLQSLQAQE